MASLFKTVFIEDSSLLRVDYFLTLFFQGLLLFDDLVVILGQLIAPVRCESLSNLDAGLDLTSSEHLRYLECET
jgi:hypothetical protein